MAYPHRFVATTTMRVVLVLLASLMLPTSAQDDNTPLQHLVLEVGSDAELLRAQSDGSYSEPVALVAGQIVTSLDVISAGRDTVRLLCSDNTIDNIISPEVRPPCLEVVDTAVAFSFDGIEIMGRARNSNVLHVVSPRNSLVLNSRPSIELSEDPSQAGRTIRIELRELRTQTTLWEETVTQQRVDFPLDSPLFAYDSSGAQRLHYQLFVYEIDAAGSPKLIPDPTGNQGFCIVKGEDRFYIEQGVENLNNAPYPSSLDSRATQYVVAVYYYNQGLYAEAREVLMNLLDTRSRLYTPLSSSTGSIDQSPMFYLLLARTTYAMGLTAESSAAYARAEEAAAIIGDNLTLGQIYEDQADIERGTLPRIDPDRTAIEKSLYDIYISARDAYAAIGFRDGVARIDNKLVTAPNTPSSQDFCD